MAVDRHDDQSGQMTVKRTVPKVVAVVAAMGGLLLFFRSRRKPAGGGGRGRDDDGGLAGVREPRRPLPPTLVDTGAAVRED
jgi:hypothetical protein